MSTDADLAVFRTEDYLETDADIEAYLNAVLEDCDAAELLRALRAVGRARGVPADILAGLGEAGDDLGLPTVQRALKSLGLRLTVAANGLDEAAE